MACKILFYFALFSSVFGISIDQTNTLISIQEIYEHCCNSPSSIHEHLPDIHELTEKTDHVAIIGMHDLRPFWTILDGLSKTNVNAKSLLAIDHTTPSIIDIASELASKHSISLQFLKGCDTKISIPPVDFLFIDHIHTYRHLTAELELFSPNVKNWIAMHDTSAPWGDADELSSIDEKLYPSWIDTEKKGLMPAIQDFLDRHPEWILYQRVRYNHGLTVLTRTEQAKGTFHVSEKTMDALQNKIILCTGPSPHRKDELEMVTKNDLKLVPFKKIFVVTSDPSIQDFTIPNQQITVKLIPEFGHQLNCINCVLQNLKLVAADPTCFDDDIVLFKHESCFINDLPSFANTIEYLINGDDAVTRFSFIMELHMSDFFFLKVAAIRKFLQSAHLPNLYTSPLSVLSEKHWTDLLFNTIEKIHKEPLLPRYGTPWAQYKQSPFGIYHVSK